MQASSSTRSSRSWGQAKSTTIPAMMTASVQWTTAELDMMMLNELIEEDLSDELMEAEIDEAATTWVGSDMEDDDDAEVNYDGDDNVDNLEADIHDDAWNSPGSMASSASSFIEEFTLTPGVTQTFQHGCTDSSSTYPRTPSDHLTYVGGRPAMEGAARDKRDEPVMGMTTWWWNLANVKRPSFSPEAKTTISADEITTAGYSVKSRMRWYQRLTL